MVISRHILRQLLDASGDAVFAVGADGLILSANRRACELLECRDADLVGQPFLPYLESQCLGPVRRAPLRDEEGETVGELFVARALARQLASSDALTRSEARQRALVAAIGDTMFVLAPDGTVLDFAAGLDSALGPPDQVIGRRLDQVLPEPAARVCQQVTREAFATGRVQVGEVEIDRDDARQDYEVRVASIVAASAPPAHGERREHALAIVRDTTEPKRLERELRAARAAIREAKRSSDELVASISHEVRTPLNAVVGLADLLAGTELTAEQREYLDGIRWSGQTLFELVKHVLDSARLDATRPRPERAPLRLRRLVADTVRGLGDRAFGKGLELMVRVEEDVPEQLLGDADRIRQILAMLIGNAIAHTKRGEIVVRVAVDPRDDEEPRLEISVRDTGVGIPVEQQLLIFEPYGPADDGAEGRAGLGLSIAAQLAKALGGRIWVQSTPDFGSTFFFSVPVSLAADTPLGGPPRPPELAGRRVLVLEENLTLREILAETLRAWGMAGESTDSVDAAADMLRRAPLQGAAFDLAIVNADVHGLDLDTLVSHGREDDALPPLPVVLTYSPLDEGRALKPKTFSTRVEALVRPLEEGALQDAARRLIGAALAPEGVEAAPASDGEREAVSVLVAEDNPVNRLVLERILERHGHRVLAASDGIEALRLWEREHPAVVVLDLQMPGLTGYQVAERIRERELDRGDRRVPIVALTAHALKRDRERCVEVGMDAFLAKPVRAATLLATIDELASTASADG